MKIAVSVNQDGEIMEHLGWCKLFNIYQQQDKLDFLESRETDGNHQNHIIEDIKDCDVIISGKIGAGMVENLKKLGIEPIVERDTKDPILAIDKL